MAYSTAGLLSSDELACPAVYYDSSLARICFILLFAVAAAILVQIASALRNKQRHSRQLVVLILAFVLSLTPLIKEYLNQRNGCEAQYFYDSAGLVIVYETVLLGITLFITKKMSKKK